MIKTFNKDIEVSMKSDILRISQKLRELPERCKDKDSAMAIPPGEAWAYLTDLVRGRITITNEKEFMDFY